VRHDLELSQQTIVAPNTEGFAEAHRERRISQWNAFAKDSHHAPNRRKETLTASICTGWLRTNHPAGCLHIDGGQEREEMPDTTIMPSTDALIRWHEFYTLGGTASATMVGLLFVAASVGAGVFTADRRAPLRVFLSASVVNFSTVLAVCLVVLAPVENSILLGWAIVACGLFGLAHGCLAWRDTVRDGLIAAIDLEDRAWYLIMPIIGYLLEAGSGIALALRSHQAGVALALSVGLLLVVGVHNAWDITVWSITRRRE
jgi:hypothetical protein